jgi:hypothetical protein
MTPYCLSCPQEAGAGKEGLTPTKRKADGAAATPSKTGKTPDKAAAAPEPKAKGALNSPSHFRWVIG